MFYQVADIRVVLWVLITAALIAVQWLAVANHWTLYLLTFYFAIACKIICHNHAHQPTMKPEWNTAFEILLSIVGILPLPLVRAIHIDNHHKEFATDGDKSSVSKFSGRWAMLEAIVCPIIFLWRFHHSGKRTEIIAQWKTESPRYVRDLRIQIILVYAVVIGLLILDPRQTLVYFLLPTLVGTWLILITNHFQHIGCDEDAEFSHARTVTGRVANWLTFNQLYHLAHHHHPELHWTRIPTYHHNHLSDQVPSTLQYRSLLRSLLSVYILSLFRPSPIGQPGDAVDKCTGAGSS